MRDNVRSFVLSAVEAFTLDGPVVEFGSYLVDGQKDLANLRSVFVGREYIGCDMRSGPGVDRVEDISQSSLEDGAARTLICLDTLEHVFEARKAADELIRMLAPGGTLLVSVPMNFRIHDYPSDYWRYTPSCIARLLSPLDATIIGWQGTESHPHTVFGLGFKAPLPASLEKSAQRFIDGLQHRLDAASAARPAREHLKNRLTGWLRSKGERRRMREEYTASFAVNLKSPRHASDGSSGGSNPDRTNSGRANAA